MQVLRRMLEDREYAKRTVLKHRANVLMYFGLVVFVVFAYHLLSDGDFSFLLTLGSILHAFALAVLLFKALSQSSVEGVSLKTLQCYAIVHVARLASIIRFDGYLPFDRSGDWLYQAVELLSLCGVALLVFLTMVKYRTTYNAANDTFGELRGVRKDLAALVAVLPCLALAVVFHPSLNNNWITDVAWTLAMYLEAIAIYPQIHMFQKKGGLIESFTSHFVFGIALARFMHFLFWIFSFQELNDRYESAGIGGSMVGYVVLASQIVQLLLMLDYLWLYMRSLRSGGPMILPSAV